MTKRQGSEIAAATKCSVSSGSWTNKSQFSKQSIYYRTSPCMIIVATTMSNHIFV